MNKLTVSIAVLIEFLTATAFGDLQSDYRAKARMNSNRTLAQSASQFRKYEAERALAAIRDYSGKTIIKSQIKDSRYCEFSCISTPALYAKMSDGTICSVYLGSPIVECQ